MTNPLGRQIAHSDTFNPSLLFPIARAPSRAQLGIREPLPFQGIDRWSCYELSWLNSEGVPQVGIASIEYPATSPNLVESKSLKLFLGSMNFVRYASAQEVERTIAENLKPLLETEQVIVVVLGTESWGDIAIAAPPGSSVDRALVEADNPGRLRGGEEVTEEILYSHLLRSLCPVTAQPDWGTVIISYRGNKLDHASLVSYLRAHRSHQGYHEECCEIIFTDLMAALQPTSLWVGCFYTRRGGIDINPERWLAGSKRVQLGGRLVRQ